MARLPLEGIRVADIGVIWAGPFAAWQLAVLGAEGIHIDNPFHPQRLDRARSSSWSVPAAVFEPLGSGGDFVPAMPVQRPWNTSASYDRYFWNRKAVSINLSSPEGVEVALRLIEKSDIFFENNSAHAMESIGIGHEVMLERNPQIIVINCPGWGRSGPYKEYVGWGALHEALIGHTWLWGYPDLDHPATNMLRFHMDDWGGSAIARAAIMGLVYRRRTGKGLWIDLAQIQGVPHTLGEIYLDAAWNKRDHRTMGNRHPTALQGCYLCRGPRPTLETAFQGGERWINITINNDEEWQAFCEAMGNPEWTQDPKFATHESRYANHDELDRQISRWTRFYDNFELFYKLQAKGIAAGPVEDCRDTYADPQLNARDMFELVDVPERGKRRLIGSPWKFSKTPLGYRNLPQPTMGEHTEYVCKDIIGMSDAEYEDLKAREVVGRDTYPWLGPRPDYEGMARARGIDI